MPDEPTVRNFRRPRVYNAYRFLRTLGWRRRRCVAWIGRRFGA